MYATVTLAKVTDRNFDESHLAVESGATDDTIQDLYNIVWPKIEEKHKNATRKRKKGSARVKQFTVMTIGKLLCLAKKV